MTMKKELKKRLLRRVIWITAAFIVGGAVAWFQVHMEAARVSHRGSTQSDAIMPIAGLKIGGPYTLVDHNGQKVTEQSFAGQYKLIYFGFTYCPAICPTELQKMRQVLKGLGDNGSQIQPIFITVDPERDTPEVMKDYVSLFHPRLIGLTGTVPQVEHVKKAYRIFGVKAEVEGANDYSMDHSSFTYLMGPDDELVSMYRVKDSADFMLADIRAKLGLGEE